MESNKAYFLLTAASMLLLIAGVANDSKMMTGAGMNIECPENYTYIPSLDTDEDRDVDPGFCLMKYEAKKSEDNSPVSRPSGRPWTDINQTRARKKCDELGERYSLVTNRQWIQAAKIAVQNRRNWINREKASKAVYRGHSDGRPFHPLNASENDSLGYYLTGNNENSSQRRTLHIPSTPVRATEASKRPQGVIWDLSGNVWEWNNNTFRCEDACPESPHPADSSNHELNNLTSPGIYLDSFSLLRPNTRWNSSENMGRVHTTGPEAIPSGKKHGFIRGGVWYDKKDAGPFTLHLKQSPGYASPRVGFRCSYSPEKTEDNKRKPGE